MSKNLKTKSLRSMRAASLVGAGLAACLLAACGGGPKPKVTMLKRPSISSQNCSSPS